MYGVLYSAMKKKGTGWSVRQWGYRREARRGTDGGVVRRKWRDSGTDGRGGWPLTGVTYGVVLVAGGGEDVWMCRAAVVGMGRSRELMTARSLT